MLTIALLPSNQEKVWWVAILSLQIEDNGVEFNLSTSNRGLVLGVCSQTESLISQSFGVIM